MGDLIHWHGDPHVCRCTCQRCSDYWWLCGSWKAPSAKVLTAPESLRLGPKGSSRSAAVIRHQDLSNAHDSFFFGLCWTFRKQCYSDSHDHNNKKEAAHDIADPLTAVVAGAWVVVSTSSDFCSALCHHWRLILHAATTARELKPATTRPKPGATVGHPLVALIVASLHSLNWHIRAGVTSECPCHALCCRTGTERGLACTTL